MLLLMYSEFIVPFAMGAPGKVLLPLLCALLLGAGGVHAGKILVFPEDGSHWVNMQVILRELGSRGHALTVVRSVRSWYIKENPALYTSVSVDPPAPEGFSADMFNALLQRSLQLQRMSSLRYFFEQQSDIVHTLQLFHGSALQMISTILDDAELTDRLREEHFDLMLTDPAFPAGVLLANYLELPLVYNVRWLNTGDAHMAIAPSPPSFVPMYNSLLPDQMGLWERARNLVRYMSSMIQEHYAILPIYSELIERHFPPGADLLSMQRRADIWLMRVDFIFDFPRPTMPNMVYIGGFQCRLSKPLPDDLEAFVQSSGDHGIIVMSLGAMIASLPKDISEAIAMAFAELPQKVVWRYIGERPSNLGSNTLLVNWLPQNDLLGHPKTRAFVAHGGTNGMYEAIYHGVPVVGLPLLFDQYDNLLRLQVRGGARVVKAATLTTATFKEALEDVIKNSSYRETMHKLSRLHKDRLVSPLDTATFWIEYVMRNKGAAHLRPESWDMPWYTYHSVDVVLLLLVLACLSVVVPVIACRLLGRAILKKSKVE
ncbi:UDP-glucuronosyltransferase 1-2-like isoform X1 [Clupea harengus]|uniref:UDP-glucuronosyltransferase 1-2-like isoform X1 n=2 Tax=Clupea harengus TaxID=7950 RepID=A0A6P8GZZ9_CLUHA|nr:UDP-glucuronosyltransferase 1-2-like isoform X1 [Clupea harengus]